MFLPRKASKRRIKEAENARRNHDPALLGESWREAARRTMALSRHSREAILPRYGWSR